MRPTVSALSVMLASLVLPSAAQPKSAAPIASQVRPISMRTLPEDAVRQNTRLAANLSPSAKSKVQSAAADLAITATQQPAMSATQLQSSARALVMRAFPTLQGQDIDALVFLVMMQCTKDEESDLRQIMNETKAMTAAKQNLRNPLRASAANASELSDMDSMRLQMLMDRRSKLLEAMSNMMKSVSDTQSGVIGNLK